MKIAMIGAGGIAQRHLHMLAKEPGLELVGHVARTPKNRLEAAQRWGGQGYATCEDLFDHETVDAAWITVPPGEHGTIERCLIERGVPFFVEKPLSAERETAAEIGVMLEKRGVIAGVGYHWRAMDTIPEVRRLLADHPVRMVLAAWHDATPSPDWWRRQAQSGGQVVEQATHLFDIARYLLGEAKVVAASAKRHTRPAYPDADIADVNVSLLQFDKGATGVFTATCLLERAAAINVQLVCEGLLITITQKSVIFDTGRECREVRASEDPVARENRAFLEAIRHHNSSLLFSSYQDALHTHRLTFDVLAASKNKGNNLLRHPNEVWW